MRPPGTEAESTERTVIAPKRAYNNAGGPGQGQNNSNQPPRKKPFDYNRVGGMCQVLKIISQLAVRS